VPRLDWRWLKDGQWTKPVRTAVAPGAGTPSTSTPHLAFDMPVVTGAESKPLLGHYFVPYPRMEDSDTFPDYLENVFMPPGNKGGGTDHKAYGGYIRNRTIPRYSATGLGDPGYRVRDMETEILWAAAGGLNGFTIDILQPKAQQRGIAVTNFVTAMKNVAPAGFKLGLMPDGNSSFCKGRSADLAADECAAWIKQAPSIMWQIGGKYVIAPYGPEFANNGASAKAYWTAFKARLLAAHGFDVHFWFCYSQDWLSAICAPDLDSIAYGHGRWGPAYVTGVTEGSNRGAGAPAHCHATYAKPWMHYARPQDTRPSTNAGRVWWEAQNTLLLRSAWEAAIAGDAEAVQNVTWCDYFEDSGVSPSLLGGGCWMDVQAYWLAKWKTGTYPTIVRDTLYLSHRDQFVSVDTTAEVASASQTLFMNLTQGATDPAKDLIEVLAFATSTASTSVVIERDTLNNGTWTHYQTTALASTVQGITAPLATGKFRAKLVRSAVDVAGTSVTSRTPVYPIGATKPLVQSRTYGITGSREKVYA